MAQDKYFTIPNGGVKRTIVLIPEVNNLIQAHIKKKGDLSKIVNQLIKEKYGSK